MISVEIPDIAPVGNAVPLVIRTHDENEYDLGITISAGNKQYDASYYVRNTLKIDISDILRDLVIARDIVYDIENGIETVFPDTGHWTEYKVKVSDNNRSHIIQESKHIAVYGGIPKYYIRNTGISNIITDKLNNKANITLSTRTSGRFIILKETEVRPLKIILKEPGLTVSSPSGLIMDIDTPIDQNARFGVFVIDPWAIRFVFFAFGLELPAYLTFMQSGTFSFQIVFTPGSLSKDKLFLRFRNSLGCYEQIEVTGKTERSVEINDTDSEYDLWDETVLDYVTASARKKSNTVITADIGYKTRDELMFIQDLLASEDIYLIDPDGFKAKATVSCEDFKIPLSRIDPASVTLKIKYSDREENYFPLTKNTEVHDFVGEWIFQRGTLNAKGFIRDTATIKTI